MEFEIYYKKEEFSFEKTEEGQSYFASIYGEMTVIKWIRDGDMDERCIVIDINEDRIFEDEIDYILTPFKVMKESVDMKIVSVTF